ncbi:P-loop containing nucleoside triphosphate hydrolase protein [Bisporella sp. PMI_857]|nr:P-loop containing nucleoside triphosphate hydrolase protein [Bisporella sp. PMI_857]
MLVKAWKSSAFNGLAGLGTKTEVPPEEPAVGKFGATIGRAVEDQLRIDLHSDSPQALVIGYLLDTIEGIRAERNFLDDLLTRPHALGLPPPPEFANNIKGQRRDSSQSNSTKEKKPEMQILHRIFCEAPEHNHDQFVYTDAPVHQFSDNFQADALIAKEPILDFTRYCSQHPEISFIVIKEHTCHGNRRGRPSGGPGSERSPRAERLHIVSPLLQKELENIALCAFPESRVRSGTDGKRIAEMNAPYLFFYHHQALISEIEKAATGPTKGHLTALVDFLEENCDHEYSEARHQIEQGIITEKHIEKLYRPNDIVFEHSSGTAYVVNDWPIVYNETLVLPCWSWKYDGAWLERDETMLKITLPLSQNCTINNLPFIPTSLVKDNSIEDLRRRGRKYWTMKKMHFGCYTGPDSTKSRHYYHTRIIVDTFTYTRMHRKIRGRQSKYTLDIPGRGATSGARPHTRRARFDPWPEKIFKDDEPDDTMVLLLPPIVVAFILQEKSWVKLDVQGVHPIEWNKKAFDRLVLEPKTKELITALVEVRIDVERSEDIIEGKGNGLMILLHGGPGTGKTLTAESVAEIAEKPLYRVTCGDIGTSAEHVEEYLEKVLYLAKVWNCVLLLDEADVFLEERTTADLERNSLVSIFLRILEYYDGILIMTSNRVGTFDEAFKSRIQVALHYEDLTKSARRTIWKNFIEVLEETGQNANISDLESHLDEMASDDFKLNGRQIRNAMTTARQLAIHRKERLDWEHVEQALRTSKEFNRYLKNVQGHTDNQWAREQRLR